MALLSEKTRAEIQRLTAYFPQRRTALLPALRLAQAEYGYLPPEVMAEVCEIVQVDPNAAEMLITFYDLLYREPVGRYVLGLCRGLACYLLGCDHLLAYLQEKLGIGLNQTTPDGLFTLRTFECLARCDQAPVMLLNGEEYVGNLTPEKLDALLAQWAEEARRPAEPPVTGGEGA